MKLLQWMSSGNNNTATTLKQQWNTLQQHCSNTATALQQHCNSIATHWKNTATGLQQHNSQRNSRSGVLRRSHCSWGSPWNVTNSISPLNITNLKSYRLSRTQTANRSSDTLRHVSFTNTMSYPWVTWFVKILWKSQTQQVVWISRTQTAN